MKLPTFPQEPAGLTMGIVRPFPPILMNSPLQTMIDSRIIIVKNSFNTIPIGG